MSQQQPRVTFSGPFHPLDDVRVSTYTYPESAFEYQQHNNTSNNDQTTSPSSSSKQHHQLEPILINSRRCWRLCLLPDEDKCLLLQMHNDPRCSVPITIYMFAVITLQRIFRGLLVRRRLVFVLTHPDAKAVLHQSYRHLGQIDWNEIRFRYWRMAENVVAERYEELYPQLSSSAEIENNNNNNSKSNALLLDTSSNSTSANQNNKKMLDIGARFSRLRQTVCAKWRASLLNMEFSRWAQYDRWQIYYVAAVTVQRAWREHRQFLVELASIGIGADKKRKLMEARRRNRRGYLVGKNSSNYNNNNKDSPHRNLNLLNSHYYYKNSLNKQQQQDGESNNNSQSRNTTNNNNIHRRKTFQTRGEYRYDHYLPHSSVSRENFAAAVIQELFRRFVFRRVFLLFVRLIKSREGAPTQHVLRAVAPSEAYLADKATGLHARFRLTSPVNPNDKFPPALVYKIFTHSNVADIGSFAPRNYVADRQLNFDGATTSTTKNSLLNKSLTSSSSPTLNSMVGGSGGSSTNNTKTLADVRALNTKTKQGWYDREENNEWRLVADVALLSRRECGPDVVEATTHAAVRHFFSSYISVPQKERCLQDRIIDEFIRRTQHRAEKTLRAATREKRAQQHQQKLKQKQRKWMVSLYAGSDTAISQAAASVQQVVAGVQQILQESVSGGGGNTQHNKKSSTATTTTKFVQKSTELRDQDIARLARLEARRTVDEAFEFLSEEEQSKETERLLQWTEHLDAAKYSQDWLKLGTTGK